MEYKSTNNLFSYIATYFLKKGNPIFTILIYYQRIILPSFYLRTNAYSLYLDVKFFVGLLGQLMKTLGNFLSQKFRSHDKYIFLISYSYNSCNPQTTPQSVPFGGPTGHSETFKGSVHQKFSLTGKKFFRRWFQGRRRWHWWSFGIIRWYKSRLCIGNGWFHVWCGWWWCGQVCDYDSVYSGER